MDSAEARARAAEMRDLGGKAVTPDARRELEQLARGWELLARRAEAKAAAAASKAG
jgi:hypothetical protein